MKRFVFFGITLALVASVPHYNPAQDENQDRDSRKSINRSHLSNYIPKEAFENFRQFPEKSFQKFKDPAKDVFENSREFKKTNFQGLQKHLPKEVFENSGEFPEKSFQILKKIPTKDVFKNSREFQNFQGLGKHPNKEVFENSGEFQTTNVQGLEKHPNREVFENSGEFQATNVQGLEKHLPKEESNVIRKFPQNNVLIPEENTPNEDFENSRDFAKKSFPENAKEEILNCEHGYPACECNATERICRFHLEIDEIQTFSSYEKVSVDNATGIAMRGTKAVTYYFGEDGTPLPLPTNRECSNLTNANCTNPQFVDGKTYRLAIAVNGQIPGPTLIVYEDQEVEILVHNKLTSEGISIHWHGMHQRGTPWMDGVGQVTQCPIGPESSFSYKYNATPSGTFWYHSHTGAQRTDGLFGALIVKEKPERIENIRSELRKHGVRGAFRDFPDQHTLTFLDWQGEASLDLFAQLQGGVGFYPDKSYGEVPTPRDEKYNFTRSFEGAVVGPIPYFSGIINGKGRHADVPYNKTRLSIFTVEARKTYRFRLVGAQGLYAYRFSIDGHKLTVVGTDGSWLEPVKDVDYIIIHTGERYDFLLNACTTDGLNDYWMRAETLEIDKSGSGPPYQSLGHVAEAILHYKQPGDSDDPDVNVPSTQYQKIKDNSPPIECTNTNPCRAVNCPFKDFHPSYYITCVNVQDLRLLEPTPHDQLPNAYPKNKQECPGCTHFINFNFEGGSNTGSVNGRNFILPSFPPQTQYSQFEEKDIKCALNADCNPSTPECSCVNVIDIPHNETVQIVFSSIGKGDEPHPIHLHGHTFHVVRVGYPEYNNTDGSVGNHASDIDCKDKNCTKQGCDRGKCTRPEWAKPMEFSIDNKTVRKDTVIVPAGGYVVINFISDNPGWWFLHCHIEIHQLEGMAVIVNEKSANNGSLLQPSGMNQCGDFELSDTEFYRFQQL